MVKEITKDVDVLKTVSHDVVFTKDNNKELLDVIKDLKDTAKAHEDNCAGLAAIQIGYPLNVILVKLDTGWTIMINPKIVGRSKLKHKSIEGCLSQDGYSMVRRHDWVRVVYTDINHKTKCETYAGFEAEVIQHECDHLKGVLI